MRQASNPSIHPHHLQQPPLPPQSHSEGERFYQNLSIYRNQELQNGGYPPASPVRGKMPSPQGHHHDNNHIPLQPDR